MNEMHVTVFSTNSKYDFGYYNLGRTFFRNLVNKLAIPLAQWQFYDP